MPMRAAPLVFSVSVLVACSSDGGGSAPQPADAAADTPRPGCRISDEAPLDPNLGASCGDVPESIIHETCTGTICHHSGNAPAGRLDLSSPCIADRMVGVVSSCSGRLLIDPSDVSRSFVLDKLEHDPPECGGESMPFDSHLSPAALRCMQLWVQAVAGVPR
jgi:hypothetical protein